MKKVFIKYNPYNLKTEIIVEKKKLAQNSKLAEKIESDSRLQEWVEELPEILIDEYNDTDFDVTFHGTLLDYEDLTEAFTQAYKKGKLTAKLDRIPAKETGDKENLIDEVFKEIQQGPFEELKNEEINSVFQQAKSRDFEVCVVATMSAGKSTLINAMLGEKLMPSKQEACTATITKIKDTDQNRWQAEVYDKEGELIETQTNISYKTMVRLNGDENVSMINMNGNIPFVSAEDISLVMIDTPGPNNARDPKHKKVQSEYLSKSSKSLVLYIMEGTFGSDDDNALLQRVADSMAVGGKQSKDRFIFVVNKMDTRTADDGDIEETLNHVRSYLKMHGINNPNLFPAAALPALYIRLCEGQTKVDKGMIIDADYNANKLNSIENLHLEKYSYLPSSIRGEINKKLDDAENSEDIYGQALIHTGIVSVEAAIRQYVQKYAKTAKIKTIVDTFSKQLYNAGSFEETKKELAKNVDEAEKIVQQIETIRQKIDSVKSAQKFKNAVDNAIRKANDELKDAAESMAQIYETRVTNKIDTMKEEELSPDEAMDEVAKMERFAKKLEPDFQDGLNEVIRENIIKTCTGLLDEYKRKLKSLTEDINPKLFSGISIEPFEFMSGSIVSSDEFSLNEFMRSKKVKTGQEYVKNTNKKWYKPWTWFQEAGYYRDLFKNVEYVNMNDVAQEFLAPVNKDLYDNSDAAIKHAHEQTKKITDIFNDEFKRLDDILKSKLSELESYATDEEKAQERIRESEQKIEWLNSIKQKMDTILEI